MQSNKTKKKADLNILRKNTLVLPKAMGPKITHGIQMEQYFFI